MKRIANYELLETLGQGPCGIVYRAQETNTFREVALKLLALPLSETESLIRDLNASNSLQSAVHLRHAGIVRVHRIDSSESQILVEMDYQRGFTLAELLSVSGSLPPEKAVSIVSDLLSALNYAHRRGALHRNIKPSNLFLGRHGEVRLSDFGFAQAASNCTPTGAPRTRASAAPEEADSVPIADLRSDLWSAGVLLFMMLTGNAPFPIAPNESVMNCRQLLKSSPPPVLPKEILSQRPELGEVLKRALAVDKNQRYGSAQEFLDDLQVADPAKRLSSLTAKNREVHARSLYARIGNRLRESLAAAPKAELQEMIREFAVKHPSWDDGGSLIHYAGFLHPISENREDASSEFTPEEVLHLEQIEARLKQRPPLNKVEIQVKEFGTALKISDKRFTPENFPGRAHFSESDAFSLLEDESLSVLKKRDEDRLINAKDGAELQFIPAGAFQMGSDGYSEDNSPRREIVLDSYCIYRHPVTVLQYHRFCKEAEHRMPPVFWDWQDNHPIVGVSWEDAAAYALWADASLPTEAQWEKAARGADGRAFPWGDQFDQRSDHRLIAKNPGRTVPVGRFPAGASPYGMMDVAGNVQQWCQDLYSEDYYKVSPIENPPGPTETKRQRVAKSGLVHRIFSAEPTRKKQAKQEHRVVRGSSWKDYHESYSFTFRRDTLPPDLTLPWVGFRCVTIFSEIMHSAR